MRGAMIAMVLCALAGCSPSEGEPSAPDVHAPDGAFDVGAPDMAVDAEQPCRLTVEPPASTDAAAALQTALDEALDAVGAPGMAAMVVLPDGTRWMGATGRDDIRTDVPLTPWGRFRIASISKTFAAAAVVRRAEDGVWRLDDPVDRWVPGYDLGPEVTLRRLIDHTSGVFNFTDDVSFLLRRTRPQTPDDVITFALEHASGVEPGEGYLYSNTGYFLLGLALEAVDGAPFETIIRRDLLDPLGLGTMWMQQSEAAPDGCEIGQGHVTFDPGITVDFHMSWAWAAGGLASSTADLCRWLALLFGGEVVSEATLAEMTPPTELSIAAGEPYGLGIMTLVRAGRPVMGHTGSIMGFRGEAFFDVQTGACVAVQTNDFTARQDIAGDALWSVLFP